MFYTHRYKTRNNLAGLIVRALEISWLMAAILSKYMADDVGS